MTGAVTPEPAALAVEFGKYQLIRRIGVGGMAEVLLARIAGPGGFEKYLVIKRILPQLAVEPSFVQMFMDEARVMAAMSHQNVCQIYELGEVQGQYFIAMEYLRGAPLVQLLRSPAEELPDPRLMGSLLRHACNGLHHAHELVDGDDTWLKLVHRDVSPQNLFVCREGRLKVLDFGVAKAEGNVVKTRTGSLKGKYAYMAPEQVTGVAVDRRTDVFAMGVVLHESLTKKRLFARGNDYEVLKAVLEQPIPRLDELRPDLPEELVEAVHHALQRDPAERQQSARELADDIVRGLAPLGGILEEEEIAEALRAAHPDIFSRRSTTALPVPAREQARLVSASAQALSPPPPPLPVTRAVETGSRREPHHERTTITPAPFDQKDQGGVAPEPAIGASAPLTPGSTTAMGSGEIKAVAPPHTAGRAWRIGLPIAGALALVAALAIPLISPPHDPGEEPTTHYASQRGPESAAPAPPVTEQEPEAVAAGTEEGPPREVPGKEPTATEEEADDLQLEPTAADIMEFAPEEAPPPAPEDAPAPGFVTIDAVPYATVYLRGRRLGDTPLVRASLPPGVQTLRLQTADGRSKRVRIKVVTGEDSPPRRVRFD